MLAEIGLVALVLSFVTAIYSAVVSTVGARQGKTNLVISGRNAALATFPLILISTLALLVALLTQDYQISYVWSVTDPGTPMIYRFTALWGSQKGSLLFWSLTMGLFTTGAILLNWRSHRRLMPYAITYMMATLAFFIGLSIFYENPFDRYWIFPDFPESQQVTQSALIPPNAIAPDAERLAETATGLNPLLRHFGMIIHPPMLYLGFVGFTIPFAFAMAALASGDLSTNWIQASRRWSLIAWIFLSLGLILGGRWAYDVLGWGGYWGWDPVENAAFLPWLVGTAFIHSVMIEEKRGMLRKWNMILVISTFSAVMFGTFATRSGVIESVHSFAQSEIGFPMLFFWGGITLVSLVMFIWRRNQGALESERRFASLLSREILFVLNNVIFMALFILIFWGSFGAPIISELFLDTEITLGIEYFMRVTPPLFLALYILMGIAPLSAWGVSSAKRLGIALTVPLILTIVTVIVMFVTGTTAIVALIGYGAVFLSGYVAIYEIYRGVRARRNNLKENWFTATRALLGRNQRRYGGYIVHLGVAIIGIGVIGSTLFQIETQQTIPIGGEIVVEDYSLTYEGLTTAQASDGRWMDIANVTLYRNGNELAQLRPRIDLFPQQPMTIAGAYSTVENDFYVLLAGNDEQFATFKIYINPLVNLVWWGGLILILGTVIAVYPKTTQPARLRQTDKLDNMAGASL